MSGIQSVAASVESCSSWKWWKARTGRRKCPHLTHLVFLVTPENSVLLLDSSSKCANRFTTLEKLLCWILVSVFYLESLSLPKKEYLPKGIPGKFLVDCFRNTAVGAANAIRGTLSGVKYNVFILNEHDYVSMIMSTYGTLREMAASVTSRREKLGDGSVVKRIFNYTETFSNHYKFRHLIDDHNHLGCQQTR